MITFADSTRISFRTHLDRRGLTPPDVITYTLGDTTELPGTQNEMDRPLRRSVNGGVPMTIGVVTEFKLKYFGDGGAVMAPPIANDDLPLIQVVEVTMEVQNPYALARRLGEVHEGERDALYSTSLWQQTRLTSQNQRR